MRGVTAWMPYTGLGPFEEHGTGSVLPLCIAIGIGFRGTSSRLNSNDVENMKRP
jgi:hypothetical protein